MAMQDALIRGSINAQALIEAITMRQKEGFEDISSDSDSAIIPLDIYGRPIGGADAENAAKVNKEGTVRDDDNDDDDRHGNDHRNNAKGKNPAQRLRRGLGGGGNANGLQQSRRGAVFERMFSKMVLLVFCIFVPVIFVCGVLFALKQKTKCGGQGQVHCVLSWKHSGYVLLIMAVLLLCDLSYIVAGIIYHAMRNRVCVLGERKRAKMELVADAHDGALEIEYDGKLDNDDEGK